MATKFLKKTTRNQIAITIMGTDCSDLKTFNFGHTTFFQELKYFMKSDYAQYLEDEKFQGLQFSSDGLKQDYNEQNRKENIIYYWNKFSENIKHLNIIK